eukprot:15120330-Alexandrium_andersonii.AAC.1
MPLPAMGNRHERARGCQQPARHQLRSTAQWSGKPPDRMMAREGEVVHCQGRHGTQCPAPA